MLMSSPPVKSLLLILAELRNLAARGSTGVFNIATDDGRFASVRLRNGDVESVTYRAKHNDAAIRLLAEVRSGRASFVAMPLRSVPGTAVAPISAGLRDWVLGRSETLPLAPPAASSHPPPVHATPPHPAPLHPTPPHPTAAPGPASAPALNVAAARDPSVARGLGPETLATRGGGPSRRRVIEHVAARYLGPIATIVCEDVLADTTDIDDALQRIASHLVAADEAKRFLREAEEALRQA